MFKLWDAAEFFHFIKSKIKITIKFGISKSAIIKRIYMTFSTLSRTFPRTLHSCLLFLICHSFSKSSNSPSSSLSFALRANGLCGFNWPSNKCKFKASKSAKWATTLTINFVDNLGQDFHPNEAKTIEDEKRNTSSKRN